MARAQNSKSVSRARQQAKRSTTKRSNAKSSTARQGKARPLPADPASKSVAAFRDLLTGSVLNPLNLVMLTRDRMQEVVDDAVERGRMTRMDANELVQGLLRRGRRQTDDVLADLEKLLGKGRDELDTATGAARDRATQAAIRARRQVEEATSRARRATGVGPALPIGRYEKLSATDVKQRLSKLSATQLRTVRDFERRNANRKSVLGAIQKKLND